MSEAFDLAGYFRRIDFSGSREPTLETLKALHTKHAAAIPFENLDPLLRRPVNLDLTSLQAKLVKGGRGGYCFEQNTLFATALDALGFDVTRLGARVRWNAPLDRPEGPRTHMILRVTIDGRPYLADVGFGGYILSGPLKLQHDTEQADAGNVVRLVGKGDDHVLQLRRSTAWGDVYRFDLVPQLPIDYAVSNWWTSTHPTALFVGNLLAERLTPDARFSLFNTRLTMRFADGGTEERKLTTPDELADVLTQSLGIELPAEPDAIWARLPRD